MQLWPYFLVRSPVIWLHSQGGIHLKRPTLNVSLFSSIKDTVGNIKDQSRTSYLVRWKCKDHKCLSQCKKGDISDKKSCMSTAILTMNSQPFPEELDMSPGIDCLVWILIPSLNSSGVHSNKLLNFSGHQFPICKMKTWQHIYFIRLAEVLKEIIHVKCLSQCWPHSK